MELREERELALERLKKLCVAGLVSVTDFRCVWSRLMLQPTGAQCRTHDEIKYLWRTEFGCCTLLAHVTRGAYHSGTDR
jgi:hypothetical protein